MGHFRAFWDGAGLAGRVALCPIAARQTALAGAWRGLAARVVRPAGDMFTGNPPAPEFAGGYSESAKPICRPCPFLRRDRASIENFEDVGQRGFVQVRQGANVGSMAGTGEIFEGGAHFTAAPLEGKVKASRGRPRRSALAMPPILRREFLQKPEESGKV
jgi:hypothetical protein